MSKLKIYTYGEPVLRKAAKPLSDIKEGTIKLSQDMTATMLEAEGVGLAGNQVGVLDRIIVVRPGQEKEPFTVINPEILEREGEEILEEGCLSIPGIREKIKRSHLVLLQGMDLKGKKIRVEAEGLLARILEHEVDHLNGVLFIDRLSLVKRGILKPKLKSLAHQRKFGRAKIRYFSADLSSDLARNRQNWG